MESNLKRKEKKQTISKIPHGQVTYLLLSISKSLKR